MSSWLSPRPIVTLSEPAPENVYVGSVWEIRRYPRTRWWWKPWTWRRKQRVVHDLRRVVAISDDRLHVTISQERA